MCSFSLICKLSISAFSIAFSILFLIALPNLRIQQLTIVYYKNFNKLKIHFFVFLLSFICLTISMLIIFTPISMFFLENIFGTKGDLRDSVEEGLRLGFYIPVLLIFKMHFYGISIVTYRSSLIWFGTIFGFFCACSLAIIFFFMGYKGPL